MVELLNVEEDISFYDIIVQGNIFRPLGWVRPTEKPKYKLIGTKVNHDGTSLAFVSDNNYINISALRVGDSLNGNLVEVITTRKVIMKNGDIYELPATEFLTRTDKGNKRSSDRGATTVRPKSQVSKREGTTRRRTAKNTGRSRENIRQRWEAFQSASPEERERMIKEFRNRRRN